MTHTWGRVAIMATGAGLTSSVRLRLIVNGDVLTSEHRMHSTSSRAAALQPLRKAGDHMV
jgi:hypothetical protein